MPKSTGFGLSKRMVDKARMHEAFKIERGGVGYCLIKRSKFSFGFAEKSLTMKISTIVRKCRLKSILGLCSWM
jgi:hypothetical protein